MSRVTGRCPCTGSSDPWSAIIAPSGATAGADRENLASAMQRLRGMTKRFSIVVPLDGSEYSEIVVEHAFDQAVRHDAPDLHFIAVVKKGTKDLEPTKQWLSRAVVEGMENFREGRDIRARIHVVAGDPAEEIVNLAAEIPANLIVMGNYGTHRHPVARDVLEKTPCPLLTVGLTGAEVDAVAQCPACEATRADSDGTQWFCAEHSSPGRLRLSMLVPPVTATRGTMY